MARPASMETCVNCASGSNLISLSMNLYKAGAPAGGLFPAEQRQHVHAPSFRVCRHCIALWLTGEKMPKLRAAIKRSLKAGWEKLLVTP